MTEQEVDYWLDELEAYYRAGKMSGNYRNEQIHKALKQTIVDRAKMKFENMKSFALKMYFMMMVIVVASRLFSS